MGIYALLDDAMLASFGFPRPFVFIRKLVSGALDNAGLDRRESSPRGRHQTSSRTEENRRATRLAMKIERLGPPDLDQRSFQ